MLLFLIFALVVVIATGIPFVKKSIENRKVLKEYIEEGLGKNEAIGKIKDTKTTNDKVIEGLFYLLEDFIIFIYTKAIILII